MGAAHRGAAYGALQIAGRELKTSDSGAFGAVSREVSAEQLAADTLAANARPPNSTSKKGTPGRLLSAFLCVSAKRIASKAMPSRATSARRGPEVAMEAAIVNERELS